MQDSIDSHLRASGQTPAMQAVMGGKFVQQIICKDVPYRSEREEEFYQISVDVKGKGSLEKSLESYVAGERGGLTSVLTSVLRSVLRSVLPGCVNNCCTWCCTWCS